MSAIAVVGGGITGLAVAHHLKGHGNVILLEASEHLGGKFATLTLDGFVFESGPDSFLAREPFAVRLAERVGLGHDLIPPAIFGAHVWIDDELKRLPRDFVFGMPASPAAALRSGVLTRRGALRAGADTLLPGPLTGPDISVGEFVRRRFGVEVLDRLVDPLLAGTRAGRSDAISLAAAVPHVDALARANRGLARGLAEATRSGHSAGGTPPFLAPRGGMHAFIEALKGDLNDRTEIRTGTLVETIERSGHAFKLRLSEGASIDADAVVLAVPAHAAAGMLRDSNPQVAGHLAGITYASVATAAFAFPPGSVTLPPEASGLLVPSRARRTLAAATWFSRKWPHLAPDDGRIVIKAFAGRAAGDAEERMDDERLMRAMLDDLNAIVDISARPTTTHLTRWPRAIPQYEVGHLDRVARIEAALEATPGIVLAGAPYRGSGISDCVKSAERAASLVRRATLSAGGHAQRSAVRRKGEKE